MWEDNVQKTRKEYFEYPYDTEEKFTVNVWFYKCVKRGNCSVGESVIRNEWKSLIMLSRLNKWSYKRDDKEWKWVIYRSWKLCNIAIEKRYSTRGLENAVTVPLHEGKGEKTV